MNTLATCLSRLFAIFHEAYSKCKATRFEYTTGRCVTRWARGAQFPGRRITTGAEKSQQCYKYFLQQLICFRKTSGSNMGAPNLCLAPGTI